MKEDKEIERNKEENEINFEIMMNELYTEALYTIHSSLFQNLFRFLPCFFHDGVNSRVYFSRSSFS